MQKKIISFSLWGNKLKYIIGALKNAELAKEIYPGWLCRFYVANSVPKTIVRKLKDMDNVEVVEKDSSGDWTGPALVNEAIFRDGDYWLTPQMYVDYEDFHDRARRALFQPFGLVENLHELGWSS